MRRFRAWFTVRRMLIGAFYGAAIGLPYLFLSEPPRADEYRLVAAFLGILAILGAVAAGFLSATGWAMLAGGLVGAIAMGLLGVLATLHLKGLIYSFLGAPIGAVVVLLYQLEAETAKPSAKAKASPAQSGVWDDELDR